MSSFLLTRIPRSRAYPDEGQQEEVREGYEPSKFNPNKPYNPDDIHNLDEPFAVGGNENAAGGENMFGDQSNESLQWQSRDYEENGSGRPPARGPQYGSFTEERSVWGSNEEGAGRD
jgi:hypothetical protein